jgi:hypothetical protein
MSIVHSQIPEFEERNHFLWFLLGLHSIAATCSAELAPARSAQQQTKSGKQQPNTGARKGRKKTASKPARQTSPLR